MSRALPPVETLTMAELLSAWRAGVISDAHRAEGIAQAISTLNGLFAQVKAESGGAIDARASVRLHLPRPNPQSPNPQSPEEVRG